MRRERRAPLSLWFLLLLSPGTAAPGETAGDPITLQVDTPLADIVAGFPGFEGREVRCRVEVEKVCQQNGCWMSIRQGEVRMLVTFQDYGFFVPADLEGRSVTLQGRVLRQLESVEEQRHHLRDAGGSEAQIARVKEPRTTFRFVASGVSY